MDPSLGLQPAVIKASPDSVFAEAFPAHEKSSKALAPDTLLHSSLPWHEMLVVQIVGNFQAATNQLRKVR
jgi:hypothetical protein